MDHRSVNILSFNVRSLVDRSRQINLLRTLSYNKIDIGFIQECHLRRRRRIQLHGYNFLYDNSPIGVAIAIKNTLQYKHIQINDIGFNGIFIQIDMKINHTQKKILVGSIYVPTNYSSGMSEGLEKILNVASGFDGFILGGDLNAKNPTWGDQVENINGKILSTWLEDNAIDACRLCDINPSYPNGSSFLDHFLVSPHLINLDHPNFKVSSLPSFSDHYPLKLELKLEYVEFAIRSPRLFTSYKNTNWSIFRSDLDAAIHLIMPSVTENLQNYEIDQLINDFIEILTSIQTMHSEKIEFKIHNIPPPEKIKKLFKIQDSWQKELKKMYHRTGNRIGLPYKILSKQLQLLNIILKELVMLADGKQFGNRLQSIKPGTAAFKKINQLLGKKKSPFCNQITHNNISVTNSEEICEQFKIFYSSVYTENILERPVVDLEERVTRCVNATPRHVYSFDDNFSALGNTDTYHFTNMENVKMIIANINNKKSSGIDGISNFIIRKLSDTSIKFLTIIYNNCLNNGYFPNAWKTAKIIPIKKTENSNRVEEFRPISLLSNIGKVFEKILQVKLDNEFSINATSNFQFGFKKFHSTQHALLKFHSDVSCKLREKICTVAVSLDIEKAFDSACHKGILFKLTELEVDPYLVKLFCSYLSDRSFCVQINSAISDYGQVNCGVPQGSVLAPTLFNLFLHDFPHQSRYAKAILYADDCMIYSHDVSPHQALNNAAFHLGLVSAYYKTWGIKLNASKSEAICIRNASGKCARYVVPQSKTLTLSLDDVEIPFKNTIKYLGITFDKLLKFNKHARSYLSKAKRVCGMFSTLMNSNYLASRTKLLLYKVAIRSVLIYGFPIWFTISPTVAGELEVLERKILRKCVNKHFEHSTKRYSNTFIYDISGVKPLCSYALSLQKKFVERLATHDNSLMNEIYEQEKDLYWGNTMYLSPVAIINEVLEDNADAYFVPDFYKKVTPGSHRG